MNYKIVVHGFSKGQAQIIKEGIKTKKVDIIKEG